MEQHPVPQPITSYEFRLVGDMTLKQFGKLASGVILALIVYGLNPPPSFLKWFLILFFVTIGVGMAFFPFEGRPIDVWILAFFKRIYSPTQYIWRKNSKTQAGTKIIPKTVPAASTTAVVAEEKASVSPQVPIVPTTLPVASPAVPPVAPPVAPMAKSEPVVATQPKTEEVFKTPPLVLEPNPLPPLESKPIAAKFTPNIAIPATPSLPNLIVGYVRSKDNKLIDGAILEIRDIAGNPARALKTNKLGQFLIATPLPNGEYEIETEKEGFQFDIIKISLKGEIIAPIEIVSK